METVLTELDPSHSVLPAGALTSVRLQNKALCLEDTHDDITGVFIRHFVTFTMV